MTDSSGEHTPLDSAHVRQDDKNAGLPLMTRSLILGQGHVYRHVRHH